MALAWKAGWVNSPRGFESRILRHSAPWASRVTTGSMKATRSGTDWSSSKLADGVALTSAWRVLADQAVDRLTDQVGLAGVPRVLLDEVDEHPAQAGRDTVRPGRAPRELEAALGQRFGKQLAGADDVVLPELHQLVGRVVGRGAELPLRVGVEVHGVERCCDRLPPELEREVVRLDECQVLEEAAEGQCRGRRRRPRALGVEAAALPGEGTALALERSDQRVGLLAVGGRLEQD